MKFERVFIKSKDNLPKEDGEYWTMQPGFDEVLLMTFNSKDEYCIDLWRKYVSWYFLPVPESTDNEIEEWAKESLNLIEEGKYPQPTLNFINAVIICYRAGLREGAIAMRDNKIPTKEK